MSGSADLGATLTNLRMKAEASLAAIISLRDRLALPPGAKPAWPEALVQFRMICFQVSRLLEDLSRSTVGEVLHHYAVVPRPVSAIAATQPAPDPNEVLSRVPNMVSTKMPPEADAADARLMSAFPQPPNAAASAMRHNSAVDEAIGAFNQVAEELHGLIGAAARERQRLKPATAADRMQPPFSQQQPGPPPSHLKLAMDAMTDGNGLIPSASPRRDSSPGLAPAPAGNVATPLTSPVQQPQPQQAAMAYRPVAQLQPQQVAMPFAVQVAPQPQAPPVAIPRQQIEPQVTILPPQNAFAASAAAAAAAAGRGRGAGRGRAKRNTAAAPIPGIVPLPTVVVTQAPQPAIQVTPGRAVQIGDMPPVVGSFAPMQYNIAQRGPGMVSMPPIAALPTVAVPRGMPMPAAAASSVPGSAGLVRPPQLPGHELSVPPTLTDDHQQIQLKQQLQQLEEQGKVLQQKKSGGFRP